MHLTRIRIYGPTDETSNRVGRGRSPRQQPRADIPDSDHLDGQQSQRSEVPEVLSDEAKLLYEEFRAFIDFTCVNPLPEEELTVVQVPIISEEEIELIKRRCREQRRLVRSDRE